LLGFVLFFHTGTSGSSKEWRSSIRKFANSRVVMAHVLKTVTDPNVAKMVGMYTHLIKLAYNKMFKDNFGTPSVYHRGRRSFYVFEDKELHGFCSELMNKGTTVHLVNLNDGTRIPITKKMIDDSLVHFKQMDLASAIHEFKSVLNSLSICKKCDLDIFEDSFCFYYENSQFLLTSGQSGGPSGRRIGKRSRSPTSYPKTHACKLRMKN